MRKALFTLCFAAACLLPASGQKPSLVLTFTSIDNSLYVQLDSIKIVNRTKAFDTVLYFPDTLLTLDYVVGNEEMPDKINGFSVSQNFPNPVLNDTRISIHIPEKGLLKCILTNIKGSIIHSSEAQLAEGIHQYRYCPGPGEITFFTVQFEGERETIKIIHPGTAKQSGLLEYESYTPNAAEHFKSITKSDGFQFDLGDKLTYVGFMENYESGITDVPQESDTIVFQFAYDIPCPGMPTVSYEGQVYNTVQIFNQCWLKENLNVGSRINWWHAPQNNGVIEKFCYGNNPDNCDIYGALYSFQEMMDYYPSPGSQGICPEGWHIPSEYDFMILEAMADSLYGIEDVIWEQVGFRGYDAGVNLKSSQGWADNGNGIDKYGFSGEPGGLIWWNEFSYPYSQGFSMEGIFWTSNQAGQPPFGWYRSLKQNYDNIARSANNMPIAGSVRCLRDY